MKLVLDTSAVIHLVERRHPAVVAQIRTATEPPMISVVTLAELAAGWHGLPLDSPRRRTYRAARKLRVVDIEAGDDPAGPSALLAAFGVCRVAGIKGNDAWIAATAATVGATLVTFDATLATRYGPVGAVAFLDP